MNLKLASWKTGAAGIASLVGAACTALASSPEFAKWSGVLTMVATALGLFLARDNNVSDQKAGVRPETDGIDPTSK